jgi:hypothetical protein
MQPYLWAAALQPAACCCFAEMLPASHVACLSPAALHVSYVYWHCFCGALVMVGHGRCLNVLHGCCLGSKPLVLANTVCVYVCLSVWLVCSCIANQNGSGWCHPCCLRRRLSWRRNLRGHQSCDCWWVLQCLESVWCMMTWLSSRSRQQ